jgi:outer membrane receptor protein involved in Fe transport
MKYFVPLFILLCSTVFAQNMGKIAGTVTDVTSKEPIPGVHVIIKGTKLGSSTGIDGTYFILNIPPGEYEVSASIVGYQKVVQQQVVVNVNRTTYVDYKLLQTAVDLPEVTIVATRPDVEADKTTSSMIVRPEEIQAIPAIQNVTDLITLSSDVSDGHFRGGREGEELYNIQGMSVVNPLNSTSAFIPMVSALEEVEVITSGFGAQYGNAQSGVVNISMKEAQSDRWRSRAEFRTRMPGRKHFGPSVFDPAANPYLTLLDSPEKWIGEDVSTEGQRYYSTIGNGFDSRFGGDTVTLSQIAYTLWRMQGRRDINRRYGNDLDYTADVTAGGPVSQNGRLFLATRIENEWPALPTAEPNVKRQIMGNLVNDMGNGMALRFLGTYTDNQTHLFRSYRTNGLLNWLWDRILGVSYAKEENIQLGVRFSHIISEKTFYDLKLSRLSTQYRDGSPVTDPAGYSGDYSKIIWGRYDKTPDQFNVSAIDDDYRDEKTSTISFDGSLTSQVTNDHQVLTGIQANYYTIEVSNRTNIRSDETERNEFYSARPYEIGIYGQDKMEFEGMIANIGLRWDLWNQNVEYYRDLYSPFRYYTNDSGMFVYNRELAPREKTPTLGRLQPRIGISFPVTTFTVFHLNYGAFVQRPSFERTISTQLPRIGFARMQIGNPRLLPQETNSYDVGVTQGLGEGFTFDVSGYYKDVKNLIQRAFFYDITQTMYSTFVNRDYADIRGFRVALTKRQGFITGSVNYTYGVATGKSSTPFNASPIYRENPPNSEFYQFRTGARELPDPQDILLDFDRTHNLIANVAITTGENWGWKIAGIYPFEQMTVGLNSFARSGRPYTYNRAGESVHILNNKRSPAEYNTKIKISKKIQRVLNTTTTFYLEINNLFDQRIYSYTSIFQPATSETGSSYLNTNLTKYEENPDMLRYFDQFAPFIANQEFLLYDNMPRSINLGIVINF